MGIPSLIGTLFKPALLFLALGLVCSLFPIKRIIILASWYVMGMSFFGDNWKLDGCLSPLYHSDNHNRPLDCTLNEAISGRSWNLSALITRFPQLNSSHLPTTPPILSEDRDIPVWLLEPKGKFTFSYIITLFNSSHINSSWCHMFWDTLIPLKFSIFGWLLTNHFIALDEIWHLGLSHGFPLSLR